MISSSTTDVRLRVLTALAASPVQPLRTLRVDSAENKIRLTGRVGSFYQKQLAQELVRSISTEVEVENEVAVVRG